MIDERSDNGSPKIGDRYLVTTESWFTAPDGFQYKSVYGEIKGIFSDFEILGIKTNRHSTNWYLKIGNMIVAGCQIYHAIKTDFCSKVVYMQQVEFEGKLNHCADNKSRIYFADKE